MSTMRVRGTATASIMAIMSESFLLAVAERSSSSKAPDKHNMQAGSTATVCGVLSELNGRKATVEGFDSMTNLYTCSVALPSGMEELVHLSAANLEDAIAPKPRRQPISNLRTEMRTSTEYFFPEHPNSRVDDWWAAYQSAFKAEHEWMEARGQKTSSGMQSDPMMMLGLVFREPEAPFKRFCFFGFAGEAKEACAYATVDVDPRPQSVCHIRMLMVDPSMQGRGAGLALLEHVVSQLRTRHLGLKFANHQSLESFYGRAGFKRIGHDALYTYMAIKRG